MTGNARARYDRTVKLKLTANALTVLEKRYLWRDPAGALVENPLALFERVAGAVASAEPARERRRWAARFLELMVARRFLPNSPTLMNAGRKAGQLAACFVLPVDDSLDSIFDTLKFAAKTHQSGGGTGFSFSRLRPRGSLVRSSHGVASGPVSFVRIYDTATETIKQGGTRRGANMAILRVDHPDIEEFIDSKRDHHSILNFNISVGITDRFMRAVAAGAPFALVDPTNGQVSREVGARALFDRIVLAAWECGDPGLVFLDRINLFNPTPLVAPMESTNPCGEQPLLPFESCNLGSLNLGEYVREGAFDWDLFRRDIHAAVRFLDNVIEINAYPVAESERITLRNRKIGLGVMGLADALLLLGLPYGSEKAREWGERAMSVLDREGKHASAELARERGPFPNFKGSLWQRLGYPPLRNATVSTVAPTGTISIIAGASSGIEPIFAGIFYRNVLDGERLTEIHPSIERLYRERGLGLDAISEDRFGRDLGPAWSPAAEVAIEDHLRMQAAFQRHSDSAVSKTINLPESASPDEIARAYRLAHELGCKGITVYRDRSRAEQVLERPAAGSTGEGTDADEEAYCPSC
jgi:ribonucleoside-diphosphate reductase alpha chain